MPRLLFLVAVLALAGCVDKTFGPRTLPPDHSYTVYPERMGSLHINPMGQPMIACGVNGIGGGFLLDTGSTKTCLMLTFARRIELPAWSRTAALGIAETGEVSVNLGHVNRIATANVELRSYYVLIVPDQKLRDFHALASVRPCDGLLGGDVLVQFRAVLDFAERTVLFFDPGERLPPGRGRFVQNLQVNNSNTVMIEASVNGSPARFKVDSGMNGYGAILASSPLAKQLPKVGTEVFQAYAAERIWDTTEGYAVATLSVGNVNCPNQLFSIQNDLGLGRGPKPEGGLDGVLGSRFLLENGLILDYGRRELRQTTTRDLEQLKRQLGATEAGAPPPGTGRPLSGETTRKR